MTVQARLGEVTERIRKRSHTTRSIYLERIQSAAESRVRRGKLSCSNLAHGFAACAADDKAMLAGDETPNLGIITAYNDMLSAHQPYARFPDIIKQAAREAGGTAQVAGGVPAMCDGVTQGQTGMELSLFSRDTIAMATAVGLSHDMFDAATYLGICDKIVPGLMIAALTFGHIPAVFVPAGPMPSGLSNMDRSKARQLYAERKIGPAELLDVEVALLPRARHLHLLRHRQLQPDADGDHGAAHPGRLVRQPQHAAPRRADPRGDQAGAGDHHARQRIHAQSGASWTSARSSTRSSACTRPAARPTTRCTWWRSRARPAST